MELNQKSWERWGFIHNPLTTSPLAVHSNILPIHKAFVGRSEMAQEVRVLLNTLRNPGGGRAIVEGEIGVGKTTLVNYHRYLWEHKAEDRLITPFREIPVYGRWDARQFLRAVLGHLSHKMLHLFKERKIRNNKLLKKMEFLYEVFYEETIDRELSAAGLGISYRKSNPTNIHIPDLMEFQLIHYTEEIVGEVKKLGYTGVFLHFDNLELLSKEDLGKCQYLFEEIRDIMQIPDIYYIFVAKKGFYSQIIAPSERVSSIMGWPIQVPPLSCEEVLEAVHTRFRLLSRNLGKEISPVRDSFIKNLYQLYQGKIRFVMDSISQIATNFLDTPKTLEDEEAEKFLFEITKIKTNLLSPREYEVLLTALKLEEFSTSELSSLLGIKSQNISKTLRKFLQENLIYLSQKKGRQTCYKVKESLKILLSSLVLSSQSSSSPRLSSSSKKRLSKAERFEKIQKHFEKHPKISRAEYEEIMNVPGPTASRDLALLLEKRKLLKIGGGRSTYYIYNREGAE